MIAMAEETYEEETQSQGNPLIKILIKILPYLLVAVLAAGATLYVVKQRPQILGLSQGPAAVQSEIDKLVSEVGKLIALPTDEKPTVATVTEVDKVKDQPFFKNAKNGDKVLIYTNAKKAILYRPSEKKIVEVGAVNLNQGEGVNQENASPSPSPSGSPSSQ